MSAKMRRYIFATKGFEYDETNKSIPPLSMNETEIIFR